jgi:enoyl-CoA hydratase/carnithine racemase
MDEQPRGVAGAVLCDVERGVATVTMNRPEKLNPLSNEVRSIIQRLFDELDRDDATRCIILTGTGRAFSSGGDVTEGPEGEGANDILAWYELGEAAGGKDARLDIRLLHKPVIAAVNGLCYGAGLVLASSCDLVVANESARFGMIEARVGEGGSQTLPYLIGAQWTKFLMFTGEVISARKAKEIGLVLEVTPDGHLMERVHDLARRIAAMPRHQVMMSKRQTDGTLDMMGYRANLSFSLPNQAILNSLSSLAEAPDGRLLAEILKNEGWPAFKAARDEPHADPWLPE